MEYTDVHGVCDVTHTEELFRALDAEMALAPRSDRSTTCSKASSCFGR